MMTLQFILINGLRHYVVGIDTVVYYWNFRDVSVALDYGSFIDAFTVHRFEPGYTLLVSLINLFTNNFNILLVISAALMYSLLARFVYKFSKNYFLSYYLFITLRLFDFTLNGLRQAIAMSIGLLAYEYAVERKPLKFFIIVVIAISFHYSAIILFPLYLLVNFKIRDFHLLLVFIVIVITFVFRNLIGQSILSIYYGLGSEFVGYYESTGDLGMTGAFLFTLIIIGLIFYFPLNVKTPQAYNGLFLIAVVTFLLHIISGYSYFFKRLNLYYFIFLTVYIPDLFRQSESFLFAMDDRSKSLIQKSVKYILIISWGVYYVASINKDYYGILPYHAMFENFFIYIDR